MSVIVAISSINQALQQNSFQALSYARELANQLNKPLIGIIINSGEEKKLSTYGVDKTILIKDESLDTFNAKKIASIFTEIAIKEGATHLVFEATNSGKQVAPMVAMHLHAGYVSGVVGLPDSIEPFVVKRKVFSNKAFANVKINTEIKVLSLANNSFAISEEPKEEVFEEFLPEMPETNILSSFEETSSEKVSISNATVVVSAGRGLKAPENWKIIEDLADELNAATACSKPVSDMGWRPHSEHVGQTGKPVASDLYIAIGISGAIQHLAGVNASKVKVAINNDSDAPFFKAADYGMVGDAFKILPELLDEIRTLKSES